MAALPNMGPVIVRVIGTAGTKEFLRTPSGPCTNGVVIYYLAVQKSKLYPDLSHKRVKFWERLCDTFDPPSS